MWKTLKGEQSDVWKRHVGQGTVFMATSLEPPIGPPGDSQNLAAVLVFAGLRGQVREPGQCLERPECCQVPKGANVGADLLSQ